MGTAHEHMLVGPAHEHMLVGPALEHMLVDPSHEHMLVGPAHEHMLMGRGPRRAPVTKNFKISGSAMHQVSSSESDAYRPS